MAKNGSKIRLKKGLKNDGKKGLKTLKKSFEKCLKKGQRILNLDAFHSSNSQTIDQGKLGLDIFKTSILSIHTIVYRSSCFQRMKLGENNCCKKRKAQFIEPLSCTKPASLN